MINKSHLACFAFVMLSLFSSLSRAELGGEFYFSPQFGGTDFNAQNGSVDHKKSWDFFYNMGFSFGLTGYVKVKIFTIGIGGEFGWKEEALEHRQNNIVSEYDYQMGRGLAGFRVTAGGVAHGYFAYDPMVYSKLTFTDNEHVNPFRKNDVLQGVAYSVGFGSHVNNFIFRIFGRRIIYDEAKLSDVDYKLPSPQFSKITTDELVFHVGSSF